MKLSLNSLDYYELYIYRNHDGFRPLDDGIINYIKTRSPASLGYFIAWATMRCNSVHCGCGDCPVCDYFVGIFGKPGKENRFKRKIFGISCGKHL